jgi:alginate O-acetyltransferase complex protein AlgI
VPALSFLIPICLSIAALLAVQIAQYRSKDLSIILKTPWYVRSVFYAGCFYAIVLLGEFDGSQFIYFQF